MYILPGACLTDCFHLFLQCSCHLSSCQTHLSLHTATGSAPHSAAATASSAAASPAAAAAASAAPTPAAVPFQRLAAAVAAQCTDPDTVCHACHRSVHLSTGLIARLVFSFAVWVIDCSGYPRSPQSIAPVGSTSNVTFRTSLVLNVTLLICLPYPGYNVDAVCVSTASIFGGAICSPLLM